MRTGTGRGSVLWIVHVGSLQVQSGRGVRCAPCVRRDESLESGNLRVIPHVILGENCRTLGAVDVLDAQAVSSPYPSFW